MRNFLSLTSMLFVFVSALLVAETSFAQAPCSPATNTKCTHYSGKLPDQTATTPTGGVAMDINVPSNSSFNVNTSSGMIQGWVVGAGTGSWRVRLLKQAQLSSSETTANWHQVAESNLTVIGPASNAAIIVKNTPAYPFIDGSGSTGSGNFVFQLECEDDCYDGSLAGGGAGRTYDFYVLTP